MFGITNRHIHLKMLGTAVHVLYMLASCYIAADFVAYNCETHICCDESNGQQLFPLPEGNVTYSSYECCYNPKFNGVMIYDSDTHQCCDGQILQKEESDESYICCEGQLYLYDDYTCCESKTIKRSSSKECCDNVKYDKDDQLCCVDYETNETGQLTSKYQIRVKNNSHTQCCGLETYDYTQQMCCEGNQVQLKPNGTVEDLVQCCGEEIITNSSTTICHKDKLENRPSENHYFCGDKLYDDTVQSCCADKLFDHGSNLDCCFGAKATYNPKNQICCGPVIVNLTSDDILKNKFSCCEITVDISGNT